MLVADGGGLTGEEEEGEEETGEWPPVGHRIATVAATAAIAD